MPIHIGTQHTPFELDVQVEALSVFETTQNLSISISHCWTYDFTCHGNHPSRKYTVFTYKPYADTCSDICDWHRHWRAYPAHWVMGMSHALKSQTIQLQSKKRIEKEKGLRTLMASSQSDCTTVPRVHTPAHSFANTRLWSHRSAFQVLFTVLRYIPPSTITYKPFDGSCSDIQRIANTHPL